MAAAWRATCSWAARPRSCAGCCRSGWPRGPWPSPWPSGGIARDVLANEVPLVLHEDFYGSVALLLGVAVYAIHAAGWMNPVTLTLVFVAGLALRLIAHRRGWRLPKV